MGSSGDSSIYAVNGRVREIPGEVEILSKPHRTIEKQDKLQMRGHSPNSKKRKSGEPKKCWKKKPKFSRRKKTKFEAPKPVSGQCMEVQAIESSLKAALESLQQYKKRDLDFQLIKEQLVESKAEIKQLTDNQNNLADETKKTIKWYTEKYELLKKLQKQLPEMKQRLTQEKQQITKEKDEISDNFKNTQQVLEQKSDQLTELQTQFAGLKAELEHMAEEKGQIWKELEEARHVLQRKERDYHTFIDIDDSLNCSICMEPWTQSGEHNICSLACGHFFGRSCITKWIKEICASSSKCPQCLESASLRDIRSHYLQQISVADGKIQQVDCSSR
ncbi:hypothetical protein KI387_013769 [Taxus chinensis]|uniref:RING-type domain-containing protein n=1 Tax=Taxus chinensis TaxID=29808 RepID=A0AA38FHN6_TAXCH|nr:hypothetical protein KI387_013769 [Taxus chinensis]